MMTYFICYSTETDNLGIHHSLLTTFSACSDIHTLLFFMLFPLLVTFNQDYDLSIILTKVPLLPKPNHIQGSQHDPGTEVSHTLLLCVHHQPQPFSAIQHKCSVLFSQRHVVSEHNPGGDYGFITT